MAGLLITIGILTVLVLISKYLGSFFDTVDELKEKGGLK
jgi:hypothetical protein